MAENTMNSATVTTWGESPRYTRVAVPEPASDEVSVKVIASGLHNVVRSLASGKHYASGTVPYTPGVDGVGRRQFPWRRSPRNTQCRKQEDGRVA
jgi:NADPH:quinone reductase-like Zn-dependent oxidoreductase